MLLNVLFLPKNAQKCICGLVGESYSTPKTELIRAKEGMQEGRVVSDGSRKFTPTFLPTPCIKSWIIH